MKQRDKTIRLLQALREYENSGRMFTLEEIAQKTGYSLSTIQTYNRKKLRGYLVIEQGKGHFISRGVGNLTDRQFFSHMAQRSYEVTISVNEKLGRRLTERAVDALMLALESYNRPTLHNRVEAFAILIINAWELFLKAELLKVSGYENLFYPDTNHSLSLQDVLKKSFKDNDPVRKNIECIQGLRDEAIHLLIPELQPHLSRLFQSSVLNFVERYKTILGRHPLSGQGEGILSLVVDGSAPNISQLKLEYGNETAECVATFLHRFELLEKECSSLSFSIPFDYKLVLTKKNSESDLTLSYGGDGKPTLIVEVPKDVNHLYPYRETEAIRELNLRLPKEKRLSQYSFRAIVFKHKIKQNDSFHYEVHLTRGHLYSEKFIVWVVDKVSNTDKWVHESIQSYRHYLGKNKSKR